MPRENTFLPFAAIALCFCTVNLGAALTAAGQSLSGRGMLPTFCHLGGILTAAAVFSILLRRRSASLRFLPPLFAATSLLCLAMPFFITGAQALTWQALMPPALALCLFFPVALYMFARYTPQNHYGFSLGCAMAAGEAMWVIALPLLLLLMANPHGSELVLYIYKFMGFVTAGIGLCIAVQFAAPGSRAVLIPGEHDSLKNTVFPDMKRPLGWVFGAGIAAYMLFGLTLLGFPRAALPGVSPSPGSAYFLLLLTGPAAGILLDRALGAPPGKNRPRLFVMATLAPAVAAVPVIGLAAGFGSHSALPILLLGVRQAVLLCVLVVTARAARKTPNLPLLFAAGWGLLLFNVLGIALGQTLENTPHALTMASAILAAACIFCLWRSTASLWSIPPGREDEDAADSLPADTANGKPKAFAAAFGFTRRELEILEGIIRRQDMAGIGKNLGISERTARHHLTGILRKCNLPSRQRLEVFYEGWQ